MSNNKRKNLDRAAEGIENPFFVNEKKTPNNIYITNILDFDKANFNDKIECQVLEYKEESNQFIYWRKKPDMFINIEKSLLQTVLIS